MKILPWLMALSAIIVIFLYHIPAYLLTAILLSVRILMECIYLMYRMWSSDDQHKLSKDSLALRLIWLTTMLALIPVVCIFYEGEPLFMLLALGLININVGSSAFLRNRLRYYIHNGNLARAAAVADELYAKILLNRDQKNPYQRAMNAHQLGEYREALGNYFVASMFYSWATADYFKCGYKKSGLISAKYRPFLVDSLCSNLRLLRIIDTAESTKLMPLLDELLPHINSPRLQARGIAVGANAVFLNDNFKTIFQESVVNKILRNQSLDQQESTDYDTLLITWHLSARYVTEQRYSEAEKLLVNLIQKLADRSDIRFFFLWLDAKLLQITLLVRTSQTTNIWQLFDQIFVRITARFSEVALLGNEEILLLLSEKTSETIRVYITFLIEEKDIDLLLVSKAFVMLSTFKNISCDIELASQLLFTSAAGNDPKISTKLMESRTRMAGLWADKVEYSNQSFILLSLELEQLQNRLIANSRLSESVFKVVSTDIQAIVNHIDDAERFCHLLKIETALGAKYIAFILEKQSALQLLELGSASEIEAAVSKWNMIIGFGGNPTPESTSVAALQRLVIDPLLATDRSLKKLIIVAEGALARLPFEPFFNLDKSEILLNQIDIVYIDSARDLIGSARRSAQKSGPPFVLAAPDFTLTADTTPRTEFVFSPLPQALKEGHFVARQLGVSLTAGVAANVQTLKKIESPLVLHLATHAFSDYTGFTTGKLGKLHKFSDPMMRSGIALAGANAVNAGLKVSDEIEDGILSALEAIGLSLRGTRLVVLSACDTGLGQIHSGEGILGLRRAFRIAGAETIISSLWKADDQSTQILMESFYSKLSQGDSVGPALRKAKQETRKFFKEAPYYWAHFTCYGNHLTTLK